MVLLLHKDIYVLILIQAIIKMQIWEWLTIILIIAASNKKINDESMNISVDKYILIKKAIEKNY